MYTSGRTVRSKVAKPTTIATATADVRKLISRHLRGVEGITVESTRTADPVTLALQIRTVVTFPADMEIGGLAEDILDLPRLIRADTDGGLGYTLIRSA